MIDAVQRVRAALQLFLRTNTASEQKIKRYEHRLPRPAQTLH
jgi:hypothetical protein